MADTLNTEHPMFDNCPFCGHDGVAIHERDGLHFAMCTSCTAEGPAAEGEDSRRIARELWNRRASPAAAVPEGALPPFPKFPKSLLDAIADYRLATLREREQQTTLICEIMSYAEEYARAAVEADRAQRPEAPSDADVALELCSRWKSRALKAEAALADRAQRPDAASALRMLLDDYDVQQVVAPSQLATCEAALADRAQQGEPVGEVVAFDPVHGWHMEAYIPWEEIGAGTKLYRAATKAADPDSNSLEFEGIEAVFEFEEDGIGGQDSAKIKRVERHSGGILVVIDHWPEPATKAASSNCATPAPATGIPTCTYPKCSCPFDAPSDPNWCARGLAKAGQE